MEVRYSVNDSYMTVLGNPQDPAYVPTVLEASGNSTPSCIHFFPRKKRCPTMADGFVSSSRSISLGTRKKEVTRFEP